MKAKVEPISTLALLLALLMIFPLVFGQNTDGVYSITRLEDTVAGLTVHNVDTGLSYTFIQEAINAPETVDGHTIFVEAGVYDENVVVNKSLTLTGEDRETTIITGGGRERHVVTVKASNTVINGFTIRNSPPWYYSGVYLYHAPNSSIHSNNLFDNGIDIYMLYSPGSQVSDNNVHNNIQGIVVSHSSRSHVFGNNITYSGMDSLYVSYSSDVSIFNNDITHGWRGLVIYHTYGISISSNNILENRDFGTKLIDSNKTIIRQNNITENDYGVDFGGYCYENKIYHNNFINNTYQIHPLHAPSINMWDSGYPGGGNYWSDYNGSDLYSGPFQNEMGGDGIGDTPYVMDENNTDSYPLMEPYIWIHAIAVEHVWPGRTALGQGVTTKIDVDIINYGCFTKTFNVTVYANTTIICQREVTLTSINVTTLTFTWNTSSVAKGNCTIKAVATPVPGETDTSDNNCTCWVIVSIVGDLTGADGWPDGKVDMRDIGVAAKAFGSYPSYERWNQDADITGPEYLVPDNRVDMRDIALIARHFGETDP